MKMEFYSQKNWAKVFWRLLVPYDSFKSSENLTPTIVAFLLICSGFRIEIKKQMVLWHQWKSEFWNAFIVTGNWKLCLAISVVTWRFIYNQGLSCFWCPSLVVSYKYPIFLGRFFEWCRWPRPNSNKKSWLRPQPCNTVRFYGITRRRNHNCCELFLGCFRWWVDLLISWFWRQIPPRWIAKFDTGKVLGCFFPRIKGQIGMGGYKFPIMDYTNP